jgi:hypothetical protein
MKEKVDKTKTSFNPAIIIPIHKSNLTAFEQENLKITQFNNPTAEFVLYTHKECNVKVYEKILKSFTIKITNKNNLSSRDSYNEMMKCPSFYEDFLDFEFMLILQLDAVLVKNISTIKPGDYDFIGAPWFPSFYVRQIYNDIFSLPIPTTKFLRELTVGNGGLSIRRTKNFFEATKMIYENRIGSFSPKVPEDVLFSFNQESLQLKYPSKDFAGGIFIEKYAKSRILEQDPYGYHGLEKYHKYIRRDILSKFNFCNT